jgi:hypothetical protein
MSSQHESCHTERAIDRRLFLGAAGALTLAGQPALAQEAKTEPGPAGASAKTGCHGLLLRISSSASTRLCRRSPLSGRDSPVDMFAGCWLAAEEGTGRLRNGAAGRGGPKVSVGQSFKTSPQLAALANGVAAHTRTTTYHRSADLADPGAPAARRKHRRPPR